MSVICTARTAVNSNASDGVGLAVGVSPLLLKPFLETFGAIDIAALLTDFQIMLAFLVGVFVHSQFLSIPITPAVTSRADSSVAGHTGYILRRTIAARPMP